MEKEIVCNLASNFEDRAQQAESGVDFELARDLHYLLGYEKEDNFINVVSKAKTACEVSGHKRSDRFFGPRKMIIFSGAQFSLS